MTDKEALKVMERVARARHGLGRAFDRWLKATGRHSAQPETTVIVLFSDATDPETIQFGYGTDYTFHEDEGGGVIMHVPIQEPGKADVAQVGRTPVAAG